jgi:hypothetical protein
MLNLTEEEKGFCYENLTREQAVALAKSNWWKDSTSDEIVKFQLFTDRLCMDWGDFHGAVEKVLGRPVWTHEFAFAGLLQKEYLGTKERPTWEEIIGLIPEDKQILVVIV